MLIKSDANQKIKLAKNLLTKQKKRKKEKLFVLDNLKLIKELLNKKPLQFSYLLYSPEIEGRLASLSSIKNIFPVDPLVFKHNFPQIKTNIIAIFKYMTYDAATILSKTKKAVMIDQVSIPQNLGAIIRNAVAFNLDAVFYTKGSADIFQPKTIRGAAGNIFQIPICELKQEDMELLKKNNLHVYILDPKKGADLKKVTIAQKALFIFGSEGHGLTSSFLKDEAINRTYLKIPMANDVESLNVAVSSGIVFYHSS
jgi:RNA methyltransferase, TrmH family